MKNLRPRFLDRFVLLPVFVAAVTATGALVPTEWRHRQEITVAAPGVVRVTLPDATFDAAQPNLADLRLLDPDGRETALLLTPPFDRVVDILPASFTSRIEQGSSVLTFDRGDGPFPPFRLFAIDLQTPHPHFLRSAKVEVSDDNVAWETVDEGVPLLRQWGAEQLSVPIGNRAARWVRLRVSGPALPFTAATMINERPPPPAALPVGARITHREEFAGETVLTITLDGRNVPLAALEFETPEPLFMRRVTVAVRDGRDLVPSERTIATGTLYRVAVDGAKPRAQLNLELFHTADTREVLVHIQNGDSPPLAITGVQVKRDPRELRFYAATAGRYTLLSGNPQAAAPRYDLAAFSSELTSARAPLLTPGPRHEVEGHKPRETVLPDVPLAGAALDPEGWTRRKPVPISTPGVQELELDSATLAGARADLGDLRLVRAGHQIPYLLERPALSRALTLPFASSPDAKRPVVSVWQIKLPHPGLPVRRLALASDTPLFERQFRIYEKVSARDGRTYDHTLASGTWSRTPEPGSPRTRVFDLSDRLRTDTLFVETDNGDNPPIVLATVKVEQPVVRLVFKAEESDGFFLLYGNSTAGAPRYDLSLVARTLLTAGRSPARLGAEETAPEGFTRGALRHLKGGVAFWGALGLVVVVLLVVVARLLPKVEPPR